MRIKVLLHNFDIDSTSEYKTMFCMFPKFRLDMVYMSYFKHSYCVVINEFSWKTSLATLFPNEIKIKRAEEIKEYFR